MTNVRGFIVIFTILSLGLSTLNGEESVGINVCQDDLFTSLANGSPQCNAVQVFVKCYIRATGSYKSLLTTDDDINTFTQIIEKGLIKLGMHCDLNVKRSVKELQEEERLNVTYTTRTATGVTTLESVEGDDACLENYSISLAEGVPTCDAVQSYVKCTLRESGSYKSILTTDESINVYKETFEDALEDAGIHCDIDVKRLVKELHEEDRQGLTDTTRKSAGLNTAKSTTRRTPIWTNSRIISRVTTNDPSERKSCLENYSISLTKGVPKCDATQIFVKCKLRESGIYKSFLTTDEKIDFYKWQIEAKLAKIRIYCDFDVKRMVEELEEEDRRGLTYTTRKSTDYKSARTTEECLEVVEAQSQLSCDEVTSMIKCTIRLSPFYFSSKKMSDSEYQQADVLLSKELSKMDLDCNLSVRQLMEEPQPQQEEIFDSGSYYASSSVQIVAMITFTVLSVFVSSSFYICL